MPPSFGVNFAISNVVNSFKLSTPSYNPSTSVPGYQFTIGPWATGSLFTDTAGTVPVTAPGDLVACVRDPYTNAIVATQATSANRPIYQVDAGGLPYLQMSDGVTARWLVTGTFNYTTLGIGRALTVIAIQQDARPINGFVYNNGGGAAGTFRFMAPSGSFTQVLSRGNISVVTEFIDNTAPIPRKMLHGMYASIPGDNVVNRLDKVQRSASTSDQGTTLTYSDRFIVIGAETNVGANPYQGRLYGMIHAARSATDYVDADIIPVENFLDTKLNP